MSFSRFCDPVSLDTNYIAGKLIIKETLILIIIMWTHRSENPIKRLVYPCLHAKQKKVSTLYY